MRELYGWEFFEKMAAQDPRIGRSSIDAVTNTASGETIVGAGPSASSLIATSKGNPIANIYPTDGTVIITSPSAIMKTAPHPNAAKLFMEFLRSEEHTSELQSLMRISYAVFCLKKKNSSHSSLTYDQYSTPLS